jgi:hypothetical protein
MEDELMFTAPVEAAITVIPALTSTASLPLHRQTSTIVTTGAVSRVMASLYNSIVSSGNKGVSHVSLARPQFIQD